MSNPIKAKDLIQNDGEIRKLETELRALREELESLIAVRDQLINQVKQEEALSRKLQKQNDNLKTTTGAQREEIEATSKQAEELAKRYQKYTDSLNDNAVKIAAVKNAQRTLNQVNKLEAKLLTEKEGSYNRLSAQYSLNKIRLNQMSKAEREATEEGRKLVKESAELYEEMKRLQEETGKHVLNVGNYKDALKDLPGPIAQATRGLEEMEEGFRMLLRNPLLLFLSAIVGAIALLFNAFKRSEKGAELAAKAAGVLNGIMSLLTKTAVAIADSLTSAFEDPLGAIQNIGKAILTNVINRIKALPLLAGAALKSLRAIWNRDFDAMKEAGQEALSAVNQAITGLDATQQAQVADAIRETTQEVLKNTEAFVKLESRKRSIRKANRSLAKSIEQLTTQEELYRATADDATRSFAEQEAAQIKAQEALEARATKEQQLARNNLSLINQELSLRKANGEEVEDLLDRQLDAYREVAAAERNLLLATKENDRTRAQLIQDRAEKDLDILIDGFDNQKTINERRLQDDELSLAARRDILAETSALADESFAKQLETVQKFTDKQIDANDLINESNAVVLNEKIRSLGLSEILEGRLLEIVRERRLVNQDLAEAEKDLTKEQAKALQVQLKLMEEQRVKRREQALEDFDLQQELKKSEFDLLEKTEKEKTEFALQAERDRLLKIMEIQEKLGGDLSEVQLQILRNQVKKINNEIDKLNNDDGSKSIWDAFGISPEQRQGIKDAFSFAKEQVTSLLQSNAQLADRNKEQADQRVENAQLALQNELALADQGYSANVEDAKRNLELEKKNQEEALRDQKKAQKAQQAVQAIQQAGNLITATTKIFAQVGNPLFAAPLVALMWGSFAAAKIRAIKLSKKTFGKGGLEVLGGGSHQSGNDTYLGFQSEGKPAYGEKGEAVGIIPANVTSKYMASGLLPEVWEDLRKGVFQNKWEKVSSRGSGLADQAIFIPGAGGSTTDMSETNRHLSNISRNTQSSVSYGPNGEMIRQYQNLTQIVENG